MMKILKGSLIIRKKIISKKNTTNYLYNFFISSVFRIFVVLTVFSLLTIKKGKLKRHIKIYHKATNIDLGDFRPSELSGDLGVDIHHIHRRGMGGDPTGESDRIENLICLTQKEHDYYGDKKHFKAFLYRKHKEYLIKIGAKFNVDYIDGQISKYLYDEKLYAQKFGQGDILPNFKDKINFSMS